MAENKSDPKVPNNGPGFEWNVFEFENIGTNSFLRITHPVYVARRHFGVFPPQPRYPLTPILLFELKKKKIPELFSKFGGGGSRDNLKIEKSEVRRELSKKGVFYADILFEWRF